VEAAIRSLAGEYTGTISGRKEARGRGGKRMDKEEAPTLEKAVRVLEEAGFSICMAEYKPCYGDEKTMTEAIKKGLGIINLIDLS
jgi:hypothetical protein